MVRMTTYDIMNHSMEFSENERYILNQIARSSVPVSAYELSTTMEKDYSTIHKACKKLIDLGFLETVEGFNDRNSKKNVLRFTLCGFCLFVTQSELFGSLGNGLSIHPDGGKTLGEYTKTDEHMKILKKWKYLHESIGWVYSLILKIPEKDEGFKPFLLRQFDASCYRTTKEAISPKHTYYIENESPERTNTEILEFINSKLYEEVFSGFELFIRVLMLAEYPPDLFNETINIIKKSKKGQPIIKEYLKRELVGYEISKKIDKLL